MSIVTAKVGNSIEEIEEQRVNFANPEYELDPAQQSRLEHAIKLLGDSENSLQVFSTQQQGRRKQVGKFLRNTIQELGTEPAFLCIVSFSITSLADIQHLLQRSLSSWWENAKKSKCLSDLAEKALRQYVSATDLTPKGNDLDPIVNSYRETARRLDHASEATCDRS